MKAFSAIALALVPEMSDLKRPIHLALSYDEEIGCLGAPRMIKTLKAEVPTVRAVIVGEPTSMRWSRATRASSTSRPASPARRRTRASNNEASPQSWSRAGSSTGWGSASVRTRPTRRTSAASSHRTRRSTAALSTAARRTTSLHATAASSPTSARSRARIRRHTSTSTRHSCGTSWNRKCRRSMPEARVDMRYPRRRAELRVTGDERSDCAGKAVVRPERVAGGALRRRVRAVPKCRFPRCHVRPGLDRRGPSAGRVHLHRATRGRNSLHAQTDRRPIQLTPEAGDRLRTPDGASAREPSCRGDRMQHNMAVAPSKRSGPPKSP